MDGMCSAMFVSLSVAVQLLTQIMNAYWVGNGHAAYGLSNTALSTPHTLPFRSVPCVNERRLGSPSAMARVVMYAIAPQQPTNRNRNETSVQDRRLYGVTLVRGIDLSSSRRAAQHSAVNSEAQHGGFSVLRSEGGADSFLLRQQPMAWLQRQRRSELI